jgi:hypothetical protein
MNDWLAMFLGLILGIAVERFVIDFRWIHEMRRESEDRQERWERFMATHGAEYEERSKRPPESP